MTTPETPRICKHGQLASSCETCELHALNASYERLFADNKRLQARFEARGMPEAARRWHWAGSLTHYINGKIIDVLQHDHFSSALSDWTVGEIARLREDGGRLNDTAPQDGLTNAEIADWEKSAPALCGSVSMLKSFTQLCAQAKRANAAAAEIERLRGEISQAQNASVMDRQAIRVICDQRNDADLRATEAVERAGRLANALRAIADGTEPRVGQGPYMPHRDINIIVNKALTGEPS